MSLYLAPDVFLLAGDDADDHIVYAPLLGVIARVNGRMARLLEHLKGQPNGELYVEDATARSELAALGLLSSVPYPRLAPDSRDDPFEPVNVSLFLTSACNLGCTYCYASANESPESMTLPIARRAIELAFSGARRQGKTKVGVVLHGGGEATLEWELLREIVDLTRRQARDGGLEVRLSIGTNGVMSPDHARFIAKNFDSATVSLDGPPDVHDRNRPTVGGKPSHGIVVRTLRLFDEGRLSYGIRMTVTEDWVHRLGEAVERICDVCDAKMIQAEPVFPSGRAARDGLRSPAARAFTDAFREASAIARARGRRLTYSGARLAHLTDRFCEAPGQSFAVTPTGHVSSCYEVSDPTDARADTFFWGTYSAERDAFDLDETRRRAQTQMTVHGKNGCADCFCKWHCAGDCSAKLAELGDARDTRQNPRCQVNRALTRDQLVRALRGGRPLPIVPAAGNQVGEAANVD